MNRLLLCTDMDRTVIGNGKQTEQPEAPNVFKKLCALPQVTLVYVTGRHLELVKDAISVYDLPLPEYVITDVGTKIYQRLDNNWEQVDVWQEKIKVAWRGKTAPQLHNLLKDITSLTLQEQEKQSDFKLSYYLPLSVKQDIITAQVEKQLTPVGVSASLIYSVDEQKQTALLDILPENATKLHGIQFLGQYTQFDPGETIFAGDSGNDLQVFGSSIRSILVANAEPDIKQRVEEIINSQRHSERIYIAQNENSSLGGNYSAGVIQGVVHFMPELKNELQKNSQI